MLSGTVCERLQLYGGPAVALQIDAFLSLTSFALGAVPLLMSPIATLATLHVVLPFYFHTSRNCIPARVGRVISNFERLNPRSINQPSVTPLFGLPTLSNSGLNYSLVPFPLRNYFKKRV